MKTTTFTNHFPFMKPITVAKAIAIIEKRIKFASLIIVGGFFFSLFIVIKLNIPFYWSFVGAFCFIVIFLMLRSYLIVKWKIDAFESVNELEELISRSRDLKIIRSNIIPNKWTICSNSDRRKIAKIIRKRLYFDTISVELKDQHKIPSTFEIGNSKKLNLIIALACFAIAYKPIERLLSNTSMHIENDYAFVAILTAITLFFLFKAFGGNQVITLSNSGVWTKKSDFQKWKAIDGIYIENSIDMNQERLTHLVIVFNTVSGMEKNNFIQKFNIKNLNKTADEIEFAITIFKQRYEKSASYVPEYNLSKKTDSKEMDSKKMDAYFVFLLPIIIILIGSFMWFRTTRDKEDYYSLKGKISYLEKSIGKHQNKSTRFIKTENNPMVFSFFVGKESGDFSPELDRIDELKIDDIVTIYYSSTTTEQKIDENPMNKSAQFIEKDNQFYFKEGTKSKYLAFFIMGVGAIFLVVLIILRIRNRNISN